MNGFSFNGAGEIIFGPGALSRLPELAGRYGKGAALVALDPFFSGSDLKARVARELKAAGLSPVFFDKIDPEPAPQSAETGARLARRRGCSLVIGIGGGSVLDTAKGLAILAGNPGKVADYVGLDRVPGPGLPTILVPTTAGTGSEVTFTAVFTNRKTKSKGGINSRFLYPTVALLDPELTLSLPPAVTAQTGMDALTHAMEAYTSNKANPLSDLVAQKAIALIGGIPETGGAKGDRQGGPGKHAARQPAGRPGPGQCRGDGRPCHGLSFGRPVQHPPRAGQRGAPAVCAGIQPHRLSRAVCPNGRPAGRRRRFP